MSTKRLFLHQTPVVASIARTAARAWFMAVSTRAPARRDSQEQTARLVSCFYLPCLMYSKYSATYPFYHKACGVSLLLSLNILDLFGWQSSGRYSAVTVIGVTHRVYNNQSEVSSVPRFLRKAWATGYQLIQEQYLDIRVLLALIRFSIEE